MHGTMSEFQPGGKESWSTYTERLGHYFVANKVTEAEKKRAILLSVCGPTTFKLIESLADPSKFPTMTFVELCTLVKEYYEPLPSPIIQHYKFNTRNRVPGEIIFGVFHVTKNTRLSTPSLHNFNVRIPECGSLGTRLH